MDVERKPLGGFSPVLQFTKLRMHEKIINLVVGVEAFFGRTHAARSGEAMKATRGLKR